MAAECSLCIDDGGVRAEHGRGVRGEGGLTQWRVGKLNIDNLIRLYTIALFRL